MDTAELVLKLQLIKIGLDLGLISRSDLSSIFKWDDLTRDVIAALKTNAPVATLGGRPLIEAIQEVRKDEVPKVPEQVPIKEVKPPI